jgi:membrane-associated phospholipid phosphatase
VDLVYRELGPKAGVPVVVLVQPLAVVVVGASRIYLGAHWMIGVLGGMPWGNIGVIAPAKDITARGRWLFLLVTGSKGRICVHSSPCD